MQRLLDGYSLSRLLEIAALLCATPGVSACFVGVFNDTGQISSDNALVTDAPPTPENSGDAGDASGCTAPSDTGNGTLDSCFNVNGAVAGYMKASEYSMNTFSHQSNHARGLVATDSLGNTYTFQRAAIADFAYDYTGTPSYLCQINTDGTQSSCVSITASGRPGNIPGALHVSAENDIYAATAQYSRRTGMGAPSTTDFTIQIRVCKYKSSPFSIDPTFGTAGCVEDTNSISSDQTGTADGHIGPWSYEVPMFMATKGLKADNSFLLVIGAQDSILKQPYFWSRDKLGGAPTGDYATWANGFRINLESADYNEAGVIPTINLGNDGFPLDTILVGLGFQSSGKLVAVSLADTAAAYSDFLGYRFNTNGTRDTSFGTILANSGPSGANNDDGFLWVAKKSTETRTVGFEMQLETHYAKAIVDSEDRILLVGTAFNGTNNGNFRILAFQANGGSASATTGNTSIAAWCNQGQKGGFDIVENPGFITGQDRVIVACSELVQPGFTYQVGIWSFDSGNLTLVPGFGSAGKITLDDEYTHGSVSLALLNPLATVPDLGRKLMFLGTQAGNGSDDVPLLSRYSY